MNNTKCIKIAAFIFLSLLFICCSYTGATNTTPFLPHIRKEWTKITPSPTHFMGRDLVPICSGFPGTIPTFSFFVKGGDANNLVVFFGAGGSCWNALSCLSQHKTYKPDITDVDNPVHLKGMFDFSNPNNPFKDWNFVFIPCCTGDCHQGSKDMVYESAPGETWTIHHRGNDNFLVVLKWITENFEQPHKIFVAGSSAGSYGAIGGFPWIKEAYPKSKVYVLGDAGIGVMAKEFSAYRNEVWNVQFPKWVFGENPPLNISNSDLWKTISEYYPHSKLAEFTNAWDTMQISFYNWFLQTIHVPPDGGNVCVDWNARMLASVDDRQKAPNYRSYIAAGRQHTIMTTRQFYTETSAGVFFLDWLNAMIDNQRGAYGHRAIPWKNVKCINCDAPTVCPFH